MNREVDEQAQYQELNENENILPKNYSNLRSQSTLRGQKQQNAYSRLTETSSVWHLVIFSAAIVTIVLAEQLYREPLFNLTLRVVPDVQKDISDFALYYFKFMTLFGYGHFAVGVFVLFFTFSTREKAFYLLLVHTVAGILNQELKIIYHNPRPYIMSPDVQALACSKSFGNPSGHSSLSACYFVTLFLVIYHDTPFKSHREQKHFSYYLALIGVIFMVINVPMSRVVLGVHGLNQILYGMTYGLWLALFMFQYVRPAVYRHVKKLLEFNNPSYYRTFGVMVEPANIDHMNYAFKCLGIYAGIVIFSTLNYYIVRSNFEYPQEWLDAIILKCNEGKPLEIKGIFADSAFVKTGLVSIIFGAYLGMLYDSFYMGGTPSTINDTSSLKGILRLLIGGLVIIPFTLPYLLIGSSLSVGLLYFIKSALPFFMVGFIMFSWLKSVYIVAEVINTNT
ncbi:pap2 superfamily phosphatase [Stylonychia lemnae]|uniref:Pap2 superfamily phosphatase n=1 Tax=Stylonychia lemnae TaxID=5949 RepID=A0A077ZVA2_STYLE|nr:pap2 superfamily phosphatase [Stylonychia lemnae]|eukprot:CDW73235.1 pap2 superfamily phosphatase [Stylonychia lemnae]